MNLIQKSLACLFLIIPAFAVAGGHGDHDKKSHTMKKDIVTIAVSNESFSTLVTALKAADLVSVLQGDGPFTVFAPTNEAFSKVPAETLNNLLKPENKAQLQQVLTYHVVAGKVDAQKATTLSQADTVQGEQIKISFDGKAVMINQAMVTNADIMASNGVIHVIDQVILPPEAMKVAQMQDINEQMQDQPTAGDKKDAWEHNKNQNIIHSKDRY